MGQDIESIVPKDELDNVFEVSLHYHSISHSGYEEELTESTDVTGRNKLDFDSENNMFNEREFQNICGEASPCLEFTDLIGMSATQEVNQKNVVSLKQALRSSLVNLMGNEWVNETMYLTNTKTNSDERIQFSKIKEWCDMISKGNVDGLPSYVELAVSIMYNNENLGEGIATGTYEDMCVNSVTCYTILALIRRLEDEQGNIVFKILEDIDMSIYGFLTNCGCRNITQACCYAVVSVLRAVKDVEVNGKLSEYVIGTMNNGVLPLLQSPELLGKNPNIIDDGGTYADMLSHFLDSLERKYGFGITAEDVSDFKIPYSVSMGKPRVNTSGDLLWNMFSSYNDISRDNMCINQMKRELNMPVNDGGSSASELRVEPLDVDKLCSPITAHVIRTFNVLESRLIEAIYENSVEGIYKWIACGNMLIEAIDSLSDNHSIDISEPDSRIVRSVNETMRYKVDKYRDVLGVQPTSVARYTSVNKDDLGREIINI